jgi:hypothetical protein
VDSITDLGGLLRYGAIGLGLALSVLAFLLLRTEQKQAKPRRQILTAVYVFMSFSLLLSVGGFVSEYVRSQATADERAIEALNKKIDALNDDVKAKTEALSKLSSARELFRGLLGLKGEKLEDLRRLDPASPEYRAMVTQIQRDLVAIDRKLGEALEAR